MSHLDVKQLYLNTLLEIYSRPPSVNLLIKKSFELDKLSLEKFFIKRRLQIHHGQHSLFFSSPVISVTQALYHHHHLLIIGDAGSGKTTLMNWLAITFAKDKPPQRLLRVVQNFLPIVIRLREFITYLQPLNNFSSVALEKEIPSFLSTHVRFSIFSKWLEESLSLYPCVILWDGLDEIAQEIERKQFLNAIEAFVQRCPNIRCILTTRPYGMEGVKIPLEFKQTTLQLFDQEESVAFLRMWYKTFYPSQSADKLIRTVQSNVRIKALISNPLLCTLVGIVYQEQGQLPHRRVQLYQEVCKIFVARWDECPQISHSGTIGQLSSSTKLKLLERIAYGFQETFSQVTLPEKKLIELLIKGLTTLKSKGEELYYPPEVEAQNFTDAIWGHRGLLQGKGERNFEFIHRGIQEYLAARYLASQCIDKIMIHLHEGWWHEVHVLTIGCLGRDIKGAQQIDQLVYYVWNTYRPPYRWLLPSRRKLDLGKHLPFWQWRERIAWYLLREFLFILEGFVECETEGKSAEWTNQLAYFATGRIQEWIGEIEFYQEPLDLIIYLVKDALPKPALLPLTEVLLPALKSKNWQIRYWVVKSLGMLGVQHEPVISVLLRALYDEHCEVRNAVVGSLQELGVSKDLMVSVLLTPLKDKDNYVKVRAAGNLVKLGIVNEEVTSILCTALCDEKSYVRICAAEGLTFLVTVTDTVISFLLEASKDEHWYIRALAVKILGQLEIKTPETITTLLQALKDKNRKVRAYAAKSLGQIKIIEKQVILDLLKALRDRDKWVRTYVAKSLGQLKVVEEPVISELLYALRDKDSGVRRQAAKSLGQLGIAREGIASALFRALRDKNVKVRSQAAKSLGQLGVVKEEVIRALVSALREKHQLAFDGKVPSNDEKVSKKDADENLDKFIPSDSYVPKKILDNLLKKLKNHDELVRSQTANCLVYLPLTEYQQRKVFIKLNQLIHDVRLRHEILKLIRKLLAGHRLPGYSWVPLKIQIKEKERKEQRFRRMVWGLLIVILLGIMLGLFRDTWDSFLGYPEWLAWVYNLRNIVR